MPNKDNQFSAHTRDRLRAELGNLLDYRLTGQLEALVCDRLWEQLYMPAERQLYMQLDIQIDTRLFLRLFE